MAESGLTVDVTALRTAAIEILYGGSDPTDYAGKNAAEQATLDRLINEGLRQFYQPPPVEGRAVEWSFLRPSTTLDLDAPDSTGTVTVVNGVVTLSGGTFPAALDDDWTFHVEGNDYAITSRDSDTQITLVDTTLDVDAGTAFEVHHDDYTLADDFGHILSPITFAQADNTDHVCRQVDWQEIRVRRQRSTQSATGNDPVLFSIESVTNDPTAGTRKRVNFWPAITAAATAYFRYKVRPGVLSTTNKYPWGASDHSETIRASVEAAAELYDLGQRGAYWQKFQTCLLASVQFDARDSRPTHLGYNHDGSDQTAPGGRYRRQHPLLELVTYNGA